MTKSMYKGILRRCSKIAGHVYLDGYIPGNPLSVLPENFHGCKYATNENGLDVVCELDNMFCPVFHEMCDDVAEKPKEPTRLV